MTQEALKLALEAMELCNGAETVDGVVIYTDKEIAAIKEALAQPEQEPVAWVVYSSAENDIVWADKGKRLKQNIVFDQPVTSCPTSDNIFIEVRISKLILSDPRLSGPQREQGQRLCLQSLHERERVEPDA